MTFCLPQFASDTLKGKFKTGELTPEKLQSLSPTERHSLFAEILGETNAKQVNALFESKLLLKNQQLGIIRWAQQVLGMKPELLKDTLAKVQKLDKLMEKAELDVFLEDLVEKKLGIHVSEIEAGKLVDLARTVENKKQLIKEDSLNGSSERLEYGLANALFKEYVSQLKTETTSLKFKDYLKPENWGKVLYNMAGVTKSILSSLDNSFFGRQGIKVLFTNPDIWIKNFLKSWGDIGKELGGIDSSIPVKADIYSRQNALNGKYQRMKLAVGIATEEAFPSSLPTKIPILGRLFKASESAYNNAALRIRADLADRVIRQAEKNGIDMTDSFQAESLGKLVNSMTGRGSIGKFEAVGKELNAALFSIKFLKGNIDTLTVHALDKMSGYARLQAAKNLLKIVASTAGILYIADQLWPGSVEKDPRSSNFGKIKIGDTRFDISGSMAGINTLVSRLITGKTKSSITGKVTELGGDKYGALTRMDILYNFAEGKTSPALKTVIDQLKGKNFQGEKPTLKSTIIGVGVPLPIMTYDELQKNPNSADLFLSMILSELGIGVNTYSNKKK